MVFLDKLTFLKVCIWSGHTCWHTFSMHRFKNAPSEKHVEARVISSATIKLFTAASLWAVAFVNLSCCGCSLPFSSCTISFFSLGAKFGILSSASGVKMPTYIVLLHNRNCLTAQKTYRFFSLNHKHVFTFPSFVKMPSFCINFSLLGHFVIICRSFLILLSESPMWKHNILVAEWRHFAGCKIDMHCGKCSFFTIFIIYDIKQHRLLLIALASRARLGPQALSLTRALELTVRQIQVRCASIQNQMNWIIAQIAWRRVKLWCGQSWWQYICAKLIHSLQLTHWRVISEHILASG